MILELYQIDYLKIKESLIQYFIESFLEQYTPYDCKREG